MGDFSSVIKLIIDILDKSSRYLVRDYYELRSLQSSRKSTHQFVDKSIEKLQKIIFGELQRVRPNFGIKSSFFNKNSEEENQATWLVNIMDAKNNFAHALPLFGLSIAVEERVGGEDVVTSAVISFPLMEEVYFAERGKGAWYTGTTGQYTGTVRLRVSHRTERDDYLESSTGSGNSVRIFGSDLWACVCVASGRLEAASMKDRAYHDIASGIFLVRESGGEVQILGSNFNLSNGVLRK